MIQSRLVGASFLLALVAGTAVAQPAWNADRGWETEVDRQVKDLQARGLDEIHRMDRELEVRHRRFDDDFDQTRRYMTGFFIVLVGIFVTVAVRQLTRERRSRRGFADTWTPTVEYQPLITASPSGTVDVTVLRLAIDGRASKFVQAELAAILKAHDGLSAEGRAKRLREVSILLRRVRDSWIYGGADNEPMRSRDEALAAFARHVDEAKTRIQHPPSRATAPSTSTLPVSLILVSIVVAARGELMTVNPGATGEDLRRALEAAVHRAPDELLAVEIVWAPTEPSHTLSSVDLEASYRRSELHPLDGALVGKVFCTYCGGPFPGELVTCPHCGAPAPGRERRAA